VRHLGSGQKSDEKNRSKRISSCIVCVHIDCIKKKSKPNCYREKMLHMQHGEGCW
jgi:hypothetical protein